MALTPDIERAKALVEIQALLAKADLVRGRYLREMDIHVIGWDNERPGEIATVRPRSFTEAVKLVDRP